MDAGWWTRLDQLDKKQEKIIDLSFEEDHIIVGPPGSGKTNLLLLRAAYLNRSNRKNFVVLTFNRVLREFIASGTSTYGLSSANIQTYVAWSKDLLTQNGIKIDNDLSFDELRPSILNELTSLSTRNDPSNILDFILIDEVQDYSTDEIEVLKKFARRIFAVGDSRQRIYQEDGTIKKLMGEFNHIELTHHYRNCLRICRLADGILNIVDAPEGLEHTSNYDEKEYPSDVKPPIQGALADQAAAAIEIIKIQLRAYPDQLIGVLVPRNEDLGIVAKHILASEIGGECVLQRNEDGYSPIADGKRVILSTIHGSKGLEFRACHILGADALKKFREHQKKLTFTACTRAKTSLRVYHDAALPTYLVSGFTALEPKAVPPKVADLFQTK